MITDHTPETLWEFERQIAEDFDAARIRAPVHLAGGNEAQLIGIFQHVRREDWVLTQWRSHYHCLLKGVPPDRLREDVLAGRSITLCYPEYRVLSSAIVGGVLPIAVGLGMAIKRAPHHVYLGDDNDVYDSGFAAAEKGLMSRDVTESFIGRERVWVFVGDMTATTGTFAECTRYAKGHNLPVEFVVENNGLSVCTDTKEVWGDPRNVARITQYDYLLPWPHSGAGKRVQF